MQRIFVLVVLLSQFQFHFSRRVFHLRCYTCLMKEEKGERGRETVGGRRLAVIWFRFEGRKRSIWLDRCGFFLPCRDSTSTRKLGCCCPPVSSDHNHLILSSSSPSSSPHCCCWCDTYSFSRRVFCFFPFSLNTIHVRCMQSVSQSIISSPASFSSICVVLEAMTSIRSSVKRGEEGVVNL